MNWAARATKQANVFLVQASIGAEPVWYYLQVLPNKLALFNGRIGKQKLDLAEYGTILHSGRGLEPPEHIKALF